MINPFRLLTKRKERGGEPSIVGATQRHMGEEIQAKLAELEKPVQVLAPKSRGRVIRQTRHSEFDPNPVIRGGRIVKVMPRKLQRIKAAQEMVENDDKPSVEDIED